MNHAAVIMTVVFPLTLAALGAFESCRLWRERLVVWAPVPAGFAAIFANGTTIDMPWLLLGSRFGLDTTGCVFLGFTSLLWWAAAMHAKGYMADDPDRSRFGHFFLLTMCGNFGVIAAGDMVSFLLFYTIMSFSAYGLITHDRKPKSIRAGKTYIIFVIVGEILLFWAVVLIATDCGTLYLDPILAERLSHSPRLEVIAGLILIGFGIKMGLMPVHAWLPLAHTAAPTPASAVLSGAIIKTGLFGLLTFLPLGLIAMDGWGAVCIGVGLTSTFTAVLFGLTQDHPKTVLAYSSVSQMGLVGTGIGVMLIAPASAPVVTAALLVYATHHAVTKAGLFLGISVVAEVRVRRQHILATGVLMASALALAGLPFTTGFIAKIALKNTALATPEPWVSILQILLPISGIATTLLIARFVSVVHALPSHGHGHLRPATVVPWVVLSAVTLMALGPLTTLNIVPSDWTTLAPGKLWTATWPILTGGIIVLAVVKHPVLSAGLRKVHIPAGDIVVLVAAAAAWFRSVIHTAATVNIAPFLNTIRDGLRHRIAALPTPRTNDHGDQNTAGSGLLLGLLVLIMFALVML